MQERSCAVGFLFLADEAEEAILDSVVARIDAGAAQQPGPRPSAQRLPPRTSRQHDLVSPFNTRSTMATIGTDRFAGTLTEEATRLQRFWGRFLALGIVQIVVGILAVSFAFSATLASVVLLGILLLIAAGAQLAAAVWAWDWRGFSLFLLVGLLYAVAGFLMLQHPVHAAEALTLMLAAALLVGGMFRMVVAVTERFTARGWVLCNGVLSLLLGLLIWQQWPWTGRWVLGMFVGMDLIMNGTTWSIVAVAMRHGLAQFTAR